MKLRIAAIAILAVWDLGAQGASPPPQKLIASDAKRLVAEAFGSDEKKAAAARDKLVATRPEDRRLIAEAIASLPFRPPGKAKTPERRATLTFDLPDSPLKKGKAIAELPSGYDGKKTFPLLFRFHGSGDTAEDFAKNTHDPAFSKMITVTPEIPSGDRMGWNQPGGYALIDAVYRHMMLHYAVDPDRVYVAGHSAGGGAAFIASQIWPQRFAAFFAMARLHWKYHPLAEPCMDTLRHVPGFFVVGLGDTEDRVSGYRTAEDYYKKAKLPGEFRFVKGQGHSYLRQQAAEAFQFLMKAKRPPPPKDFCAVYAFYSDQPRSEEPLLTRQYWLEATKYSEAGTVCRVTVDGNVVDIAGERLESGAILLNDEIVDLDKPVTVRLNGKTVSEEPVERSVEFLLDWFAAERDRRQLYWNRVRF